MSSVFFRVAFSICFWVVNKLLHYWWAYVIINYEKVFKHSIFFSECLKRFSDCPSQL